MIAVVFYRDGTHESAPVNSNQGWNFDLPPNQNIRRIFLARTEKDAAVAIEKWGKKQ